MVSRILYLVAIVCLVLGVTSSQAGPFIPQPDLIVGLVGTNLTGVKIQVKNRGLAKAGASKLSMRVFDTTGKLIFQGTALVPAILGTKSTNVIINTAPVTLPVGTRIEIAVDVGNQVRESVETNNTKVHVVTTTVVAG